jgi:class 3 adenylate cyclase/tetratricopeptide (TPR) repeat protein
VICPHCGQENPEIAKFCLACATPLTVGPEEPSEERKVVTVLFCDLVGFTAASDAADPEDVRARIRPYHQLLRTEIASFGGTVEKFIGDAVMAVFGAPVAHEDDPERALRAGLRILEAIEELNEERGLELAVREAVETGEAVVALGARPEEGEGIVTGDVVNTASRLQGVAPAGTVVAGEGTYRAAERVFDWEPLPAVQVKGKAEPLSLWRVLGARARFGVDLTRTHATPLVGREWERNLLTSTLERSIQEQSVNLVTMIGEPGVGKSRLVAELFAFIEDRPDFVRWRQGRSLPYGDGISFWALGEIVKAEAGILESDSPEAADEKLRGIAPAGADQAWFHQRLRPLVGLDAPQAEREENFAAWRRFLESLAEAGPSVFVLEDLHWADDAMLAFVEHVVEFSDGVPMLLVATARPELLEQAPTFTATARNAMRINLAALSDQDTAQLIGALLGQVLLPAEVQAVLLDRAGGNPLYAEEFVRLLRDTGALSMDGGTWTLDPDAEVPLPSEIQGLIAARLDTLSPERKQLLQDASVIGKVFWAGAVAQMSGQDKEEVSRDLHELARKELVRPARRSSIEGEAEYAFWHILARDVVYAQIPRSTRAAKHAAAARWIEGTAPERIEDHAEVLAYHYVTALELARSAAQTGQISELETSALRFLTLAGERALGLDTAAALANFRRALALTPEGHPARPETLSRFGVAACQAGYAGEALEALQEAIDAFEARGEIVAAAEVMSDLCTVLRLVGDPSWYALPAEMVALLEPLGPGPELIAALTEVAAAETIGESPETGVRFADRALVLAEELGLPRPARALGYRGLARSTLGDPDGLEDMREALKLALEAGQGREVGVLYNNLGMELWISEGPSAALDVLSAGFEFATARGLAEILALITGSSIQVLIDAGRIDEALNRCAHLAEPLEARRDIYNLILVRSVQATISAIRGEARPDTDSLDWIEATARRMAIPDVTVQALTGTALTRVAEGQKDRAGVLLAEVESTAGARESPLYPANLAAMVRIAVDIDDLDLAERLMQNLEPRSPYAAHALAAANAIVTEARGDPSAAAVAYADAAERWQGFGHVPERAFALLGEGRCLAALGRHLDAMERLRISREIFVDLGIRPAIEEADALLAEAIQLSS